MKSRGFQGKFFTDPYVQDLNLSEKLTYIYYLYNERVNWLGTYEVSDKTALFEIGDIKLDTLQRIKSKFQSDGKILFTKNFVIIKNSERYECHLGNKQLTRSALSQFKALPDEIKSAFLSFKPKEVINIYSATFLELGYELPSSLLVAYEYPTSSQLVDEVISNKKKVISNKKEEEREKKEGVAYDVYLEIIQHYNETFEKQTKSYQSWKPNCDYWLKTYSLGDIKQAITNCKRYGWWAKDPSIELFFRTKSKSGEPVDYIDQLLNSKEALRERHSNDPLVKASRKALGYVD